ncbi:uncharacterized protein stg1 [Drosophila takahashii]|uniref:uncharacterized protein stg1 n=1 Tax=Drosophila takahashii TaxID=29030 RepID=UPI003898EDC2
MRDYPSVPNVFRVASTHSINSMENPYNNIRPANVNCNTIERQQQQPLAIHQLTTSASIEHSHPSQQQQLLVHHQQQQQQQQPQHHSPYATLPRGQRFAPQQHQQTGLINTISGSIPATGFSSLANSFSDLQLNNIGNQNRSNTSNSNQRQQQQQQHRQQQQQQQRQVASLSRHQPVKEVQQQQKQQQHVQRQQQHRMVGGVASGGATDPPTRGISNITNVNGGYLWLLTPVAASISVAIVIAALAGPQWLFTEEKLPNANYNGTANFKALDDGAYITKCTKSSLWILCTTLPGQDADSSYNCVKIDYFPDEGYQPDPHDSTAAIPYTVTKSCPIFLAAGVFLVISFIVFLIPTCSHRNNLYYFSAGILFIVSGLVMLIGLIAYISILKAEIGSKLRPRSTLQPALIKVSYGQSFFLFVFGFIVTEFVGVLNIFLFINLQEVSYYNRLPCFSVANIHAKFKEGPHPLSDSYKRYKQPGNTTTASQEGLSQQGHQQGQQGHQHLQPSAVQPTHGILRSSANSRLHQVHDAGIRGNHPGNPGHMMMGHPGQTQTLPGACRRHPNAGSNLNLYLHNDLERRFYFEKPAVSKCNLHSRSFAKSLNELCTEASVTSTHVPLPIPVPIPAPLPAPPPPSSGDPDRLPAPPLFADLPQEFPLTRSVSTATEIYTGSAAPPSAQMKRKQQRNMATNTNTKVSNNPAAQLEDQSRLCGLKRGLRKTKDELFQEFCRRAGMRSKPKNIYYISGGGEEAEEEEEGEGQQEQKVKREEAPQASNRRDDDDDADGDDHGFRQFNRMEEDHLYVVGDHAALVMPRRTSMCVDSLGQPLRRLNSNLSLHTADSSYSAVGGGYPGMGMRMPLPPPSGDLGQSRTLPRCFLRQSSDSLASQGYSLGASSQRFSQLMLNHQQQNPHQQLARQNLFVSSTLTLPQVGHPPGSKGQVQWPTAIPSSPSNYANGYQQHPQPIYPTPGAGGTGGSVPVSGPSKFQRGYAFDDQQRRSSFVSDAFDLDEIERDRRRSHASLFGLGGQNRDPYDLINGTAV